ncbi:hypothetical protein M407DRAFT_241857 [Tulasnella calospora MUT 4182]|uniref:Uncharacterized protein n=1 Tax=Tulasnella calospora MUT 4182 TaxID=1051891 RepID=A0A0C3LBT3_9AGAM|nr:hypothetical protein M407DRAFT_241857 [Tulasnella calospora MUT 4182]
MTLEECAAKIEEKPDTTQVRFISCKPRFVVMVAYDETDSTEVEKIINLETQGKRLKEVLKQRELRDVTSKVAPESTKGKGKGKNEAKEPEDESAKTERDDPACSTKDDDQLRKFDTKALLRTLEPRSCLLLLGPDPLPAESGKKGR